MGSAAEAEIGAAYGSINAQQSKGTEKTYTDTLWLLNYTATHPNATICYTTSDMILHIHSDASYLSKPRARSRAGGHYFLGDKRPDISKPPTTRLHLNIPIHSISQIMSNVMGSAAEPRLEPPTSTAKKTSRYAPCSSN